MFKLNLENGYVAGSTAEVEHKEVFFRAGYNIKSFTGTDKIVQKCRYWFIQQVAPSQRHARQLRSLDGVRPLGRLEGRRYRHYRPVNWDRRFFHTRMI